MEVMSTTSMAERSFEERAHNLRQGLAKILCHMKVPPCALYKGNNPNTFAQLMIDVNPEMSPFLGYETLEHDCLKLYDVEKDQVKEIFSKLDGQICLSVDTLVDTNDDKRCNHYLCLSAQFVNSDWKLKKWVIKFFPVSGDKNSSPCVAVMNAIREYNIDSKIFAMTVGSASDLADEVKENVQEQMKLPLNGQLFHVKCCCDLISQMVQKGFEHINKINKKVKWSNWSKTLPLWFRHSRTVSDALGEFNSAKAVPSKKDRKKFRSVCKIIDKVYEIMEWLFELKRPSANLYLPYLQEIRVYLTAESANCDPFVSLLAQELLEIFNKYWNDTFLVLSVAAFLDPRYKLKFVEFCSSEADTVLENIRKIYDGYAVPDQKEYMSSSESEEDDDEEEEEETEGSKTPSKKYYRPILEKLSILKEYCQSMNHEPQMSELDLYLAEPTLPWTDHFSVLNWWKDNRFKYPQLSQMARDFLAIPMSVATRYEAYCTEPREFDSTLTSSEPKLMNVLMCTRSWKFGDRK